MKQLRMWLLYIMQAMMMMLLPITPAFAQDWWPLSISVYLNGQSENQLRGIKRFPAIVIDGRFVAEGEFDIHRAVRLWRHNVYA